MAKNQTTTTTKKTIQNQLVELALNKAIKKTTTTGTRAYLLFMKQKNNKTATSTR